MTDAPAPPLPARQATRPPTQGGQSPAQGGQSGVKFINGVAVHGVNSRSLPKTNTVKHGLHGNKKP
jgi:hypothetical protein